ncbi:acyltransferase family protein [Dysgonomonas massiliensis]|uniref:acyltransferase family protein n=1 Tax=Dysgonomonas massiliensis TaxID=2040292 RepID=UPI000C7892C0
MPKTPASMTAFADTKPHYNILDGLRGVAALIVLIYHVFEGFATSPFDQGWNHGYLSVQFFFMLSGFVIGYAYDDRWTKMSTKEFFKRRLIRLHPMVVLGVLMGVIAFLMQGSVQWDGTKIATSAVMLAMLCTLFMIPSAPETMPEIRGNGELFPLNGPYWSLFLEYVGNIIYALLIRRLSTRWLKLLVALTAVGVACYAIGNGSGYGHLGVGWTMANNNLCAGFLCMMFCFSAGLLMARVFRPIRIRGAFWLCSLGLIALTAVPHLGGESDPWMNGIYDALCVIVFFPLLIWLGASGVTSDSKSTAICKFCGDISYPVYVIHYPSMYLFYAWVWDNELSFSEAWYVGLGLIVGNILLAYIFLKFYDMPVRKYLISRFLKPQK